MKQLNEKDSGLHTQRKTGERNEVIKPNTLCVYVSSLTFQLFSSDLSSSHSLINTAIIVERIIDSCPFLLCRTLIFKSLPSSPRIVFILAYLFPFYLYILHTFSPHSTYVDISTFPEVMFVNALLSATFSFFVGNPHAAPLIPNSVHFFPS